MEPDFRKLILGIVAQIPLGINASRKIKTSQTPKQIIICGMGGSALAGEFIKIIFEKYNIKIPVVLHKDYDLPLTTTKNSLIICVSYSGDTEETISAYKKALSSKNKIIAIANKGALEKLAVSNKTPFIKIDFDGAPPRLSVLFMLSALLGVFVNSKILPNKVLLDLRSANNKIDVKKIENDAYALAKKIGSKTPIIYSSSRSMPLGYFLKIALNENSKIHAFSNILPESQHNEIQGFSDKLLNNKFYCLFIEDGNDADRMVKRMDIMTKIIAKNKFGYSTLNAIQDNIFEKIIFILFFGSFLSLKIAQSKKIDPLSTPLIDELKSALKK